MINKIGEIFLKAKNFIKINTDIHFGQNIVMENINGSTVSITIDGKNVYTDSSSAKIDLTINSDVDSIQLTSGSVKVNGSVKNVKTTSGDIECGDVSGDASSVSGDIKALNISGNVKTVSGDIKTK